MSRHSKPQESRPHGGRRIALATGATVFTVVMLIVGVLSAVSFARPDHPSAPPTEAKFFTSVVHDASNLKPHQILLATDFSGRQSIRVKKGQSLSSIAAKVLGSPRRWPILWWDNKRKVPNPNALRVGIRLHFGAWHHVRPWLSQRAMNAIPKPPPAPAPSAPTSTAPVATAPSVAAASFSGAPGSFQACVIARESGGNPSAVNPASGAGGLYQFLPSTWAALGFSGLPEDASVATQNAAFEKAYAESGTNPWRPYDGC